MLDDLLRRGIVRPCLTRSSVLHVLGPPYAQSTSTITYAVGQYRDLAEHGFFDIDLWRNRVIGVDLPIGEAGPIAVPGPWFRHWPAKATRPKACRSDKS